MKEVQNDKDYDALNDEINLLELFNAIFEAKFIIIYFTIFAAVSGLILGSLIPVTYESKAILNPTNSSANAYSPISNYAGIASLAGINLNSADTKSNYSKALEKISSLSFFEENILPNIYLPDLMAIKSWDYKTKILSYNNNIYNEDSNKWVRDYAYPKEQIPSAQESYKVFITRHLDIKEDKASGFLSIKIQHQSPYIAKQWIELMIREINDLYSLKDRLNSERTLAYLEQQMERTSLHEIKQTIAALIQEETKKLALIEANDDYVFEYIDPPVVMEKKSGPNRLIILTLSIVIGIMFGVLFILIRHYIYKPKSYLG